MCLDSVKFFPTELQELVVDGISSLQDEEERRKALQTCLFVSRTFRLQARSHLFSSVSIYNNPKGLARLALLRHLVEFNDGSPRSVASSIRHLFILNVEGDETTKDLLDNGDLVAIMSKIHGPNHGIETFVLVMDIFHSISWNELSVVLQQSLRNLCRSPHLKSLEISHLYQLPPTFFNGTYLQYLVLHDMSFSVEEAISTYGKAPTKDHNARVIESPPQLILFETDHTFLFPKAWTINRNVRDLTTPLSPFTQLVHLTVSISPSWFEQLHWITLDILETAFQSLERLSFNFSGHYSSMYLIILLSQAIF